MKIIKHGIWSAVIILSVAFTFNGNHTTAMAVTQDEQATTSSEKAPTTDVEQKRTQMREKVESAATERRETAKEKLSAAKLKVCEKRKANINNRITRISERTTKHLELFNKISERTQAFYTNKGNTLANYDELVADVNNKKVAAEATVTATTASTSEFTCDTTNPKQGVEEFRTSLKNSITALKEYRTSVKNLIVGVKSVNGAQYNKTNSAEGVR